METKRKVAVVHAATCPMQSLSLYASLFHRTHRPTYCPTDLYPFCGHRTLLFLFLIFSFTPFMTNRYRLVYRVMEGRRQAATAGSSSSSSWRDHCSKPFPHSLLHHPLRADDNKESKVEDSDDDMFTVPDVEASPAPESGKMKNNEEHQHGGANSKRRTRGRNSADKEYRRLKRLLRNRVSAQQARERKKVYVNELEGRAKELQDINSKLDEKISTLINENNMLRKILLNTRPKVDESIEPTNDH